jgi:transposase
MRKIRLILDYRLSKGISADQTSQALSVSKGSVINILRRFEGAGLSWPLPESLSDSALEEALFPLSQSPQPNSTPLVPLPDIAYIAKELTRKHVTLQRLFEDYHELHPDGLQRSAYYDFVARHRTIEPSMKMTHKGGDKVFVDYSGDGLSYIDLSTGELISVELFVCSWGASSYTYSEATETQKTKDFTMSHVRSLAFFGVAPFAFVPDNLKSGVIKSDRYDPVTNPMYEAMAKHYNVAILPARVRKPKDKAVVESNCLHFQRFALARLRNRQFFSLQEINAALREEVDLYNTRPMKEYGNQIRKERFELLDKPFAQSLPVQPFTITKMKRDVRVAPNYHIRFEDHFYSVPFNLISKLVDVYQKGMILELYHDNIHICRHQAASPNFGYTTIKEHMPPNHAFVKGWSKEWFITKAMETGPATADIVAHIMRLREHVEQGFNAAMGVLQLTKAYPSQRVESACQRALYFKAYSLRTIKSILEKQLDKQVLLPLPNTVAEQPILHENIRGSQYYNQ